jgi:hypothetical protein
MVFVIIFISAMTLGTIVLISWPLIGPQGDAARAASRTRKSRELDDALNRSLDAITEIDFDHRAGHLSDDDFAELDENERARALELLRRKDAQEGRV